MTKSLTQTVVHIGRNAVWGYRRFWTSTNVLRFIGVVVVLGFHDPIHALSEGDAPPPSEPGRNLPIAVSLISNKEFWLAVVVLTFGTIIVFVQYFLLKRFSSAKIEEIVRLYTVTLVIIGTMLLITSGFSSEQIAPAVGLFGTIAGYLLGRSNVGRSNDE